MNLQNKSATAFNKSKISLLRSVFKKPDIGFVAPVSPYANYSITHLTAAQEVVEKPLYFSSLPLFDLDFKNYFL